jgi:hypothetical protein
MARRLSCIVGDRSANPIFALVAIAGLGFDGARAAGSQPTKIGGRKAGQKGQSDLLGEKTSF